MKYIILSDCKSFSVFKEPRQLSKVCGEPVVKRTIRLLKENGVKDILITAHDKRFDNLGAKRYEPLYNDWNYEKQSGYWLSAFPIELLNEPVCFLFGDVYYSENAIKKIIETPTDSTLFFCSYKNQSKKYIKHHDEPLAYKVADYDLFKKHIEIVKKRKDNGECCREPIVWELYRDINGQYINEHIMTENYVVINDESCDIDSVRDIMLLNIKLGGIELIKVEAIEPFTLARFDEITNIVRKGADTQGQLNAGDTFECTKEMADYLTGNNALNKVVVKVIEVEPEKTIEERIEDIRNIDIGEPIPKEKFEKIKKEFELKPKKKKSSKK